MAVERLKTCDNIVALSKQLGVHLRLLYKWRDQFAPFDEHAGRATGSSPQATLHRKLHQLKRVLVVPNASMAVAPGDRASTARAFCNWLIR
jgi:transposase-like protein